MKPRLNLVMSEKSKQRLDRLMKITEADSSAEVIKNALQLYEVIVDHSINNYEFLIKNRVNGETKVYSPFITAEVPKAA